MLKGHIWLIITILDHHQKVLVGSTDRGRQHEAEPTTVEPAGVWNLNEESWKPVASGKESIVTHTLKRMLRTSNVGCEGKASLFGYQSSGFNQFSRFFNAP